MAAAPISTTNEGTPWTLLNSRSGYRSSPFFGACGRMRRWRMWPRWSRPDLTPSRSRSIPPTGAAASQPHSAPSATPPDWSSSIAAAVSAFGSRAVIGAGTVLQVRQVEALQRIGARMIVTPNTAPPVIARARAAGMWTCIGCMSATEAFAALDAGAQMLKIFPASALGPAHIRAPNAVLPPAVPVFAVGGISTGNLPAYLAAGCAGAGLDGEL